MHDHKGVPQSAAFAFDVACGALREQVGKNRVRLQRKSRWLTIGQSLLLVALAPVGGYFVYALATEAA